MYLPFLSNHGRHCHDLQVEPVLNSVTVTSSFRTAPLIDRLADNNTASHISTSTYLSGRAMTSIDLNSDVDLESETSEETGQSSVLALMVSFLSFWLARQFQYLVNCAKQGEPTSRGEQHFCVPMTRWEEQLHEEYRHNICLQKKLCYLALTLTFSPLFLLLPVAQPFWIIAIVDLVFLMGVWSAIIRLQLKLQHIAQQRKRARALRHVFRRSSHLAHHEPSRPSWMATEMTTHSDSHGMYYDRNLRSVQLHLQSDDLEGLDPNSVSPELLILPPPAYLAATREPPAYAQELSKPPIYALTSAAIAHDECTNQSVII
ncbi:hypothetical protein BDF19DRAFT_435512 [Syncephalis fuscata]|nr:hypothetical protein BDF19DRAFT_435512 [Syncephalis fuscata]